MINIGFHTFKCENFITSPPEPESFTAIVGPIRVIEAIAKEGDKEYIVKSGCNAYYRCECPNCRYSKASRSLKEEWHDNNPHAAES